MPLERGPHHFGCRCRVCAVIRAKYARDDASREAAELLRLRIEGGTFKGEVRERLRSAASAAKFFDPACNWAPERDFELCTALDSFDFVLRLEPGAGPASLKRIEV